MKLSKETLAILRNFSQHTENICLFPGNRLSIVSADESVVAYSDVKETFPVEFGIYDIAEFLSAYGLFEDPELEFTSSYVKIYNGDYTIKYYPSPRSALALPKLDENNSPGVINKFPKSDITIELSAELFSIIQKTASVLKSPDISIIGDGTNIIAIARDKTNSTANTFETPIGKTNQIFTANLKNAGMKFLPGNYQINISTKKVAMWVNKDHAVTYYVGLENDSSFE